MPTKDESHTNIVDTSSATAPRNKWLSRLVILVRILVGCTFIFSGIVKLIDPMGTMYKIEDYMQAFGMSLYGPAAYYAAVFLSIIEFVLGFNALLGSYLRKTPLFLLIFMAIMTPLTLYLAIANPIPDCGCFGDAITLSNWATFIKNVILLTLVIFLVQFNTRTRSVFHREIQAFIVTWVVIFGLALVYYAHAYSPILDFRPYKVGTDLAAAYFGDDEAMVEYDFVYERDGKQGIFGIDNLPDESDGWQFVERRERSGVTVAHQEKQSADYFVVYDGNDDVTESILSHEGYQFILFSEDLKNANDDHINKVHELYDYAREYNYPFYAVTASSPSEIEEWLDNAGGEFSFMFMDKTTIRTIQRANPFVMVLKDGVIYHKYYINHLPSEALLTAPVENIATYAQPEDYREDSRIAIMAVVLLVPILMLYFTERVALFALRRFRRWRKQQREQIEQINN